jgi:hypothetical protein
MRLCQARMITITFSRSNHMNSQSRTLRRIGEGLLALLATAVSLLILQFAMAA